MEIANQVDHMPEQQVTAKYYFFTDLEYHPTQNRYLNIFYIYCYEPPL